jgi:hypothetical protein
MGSSIQAKGEENLYFQLPLIGNSFGSPTRIASMLSPRSCDIPCWHGIVAGETTFQEVIASLGEDTSFIGDNSSPSLVGGLCWKPIHKPFWKVYISDLVLPHDGGFIATDDPIGDVELWLDPGAVRLGDALVQFGTPTASQLCRVPIPS